MGEYTKDQLLARLKELQIEFASCTHPAVLTVEAQAKYVGHLGGGISKNLFLKDKKHRYYIVSALAATTVDLKVLSQRLGLGKGGLRMAPEEALQEILKVSLGCVTPFATIHESAQSVSLLMDERFKAQQGCLFHPLSNEMTISLSTRDLDKFLVSMGRKPVYVDLEAAPLVGKDQPPDLAFLIPSGVPKADQPVKAVKDEVPSEIQFAEKNLRIETTTQNVNKKKSPEKVHSTPVADVRMFVDELIEKMSTSVLSEIAKKTDKEQKELLGSVIDGVKKNLGPSFNNLAMSFKNAAYTEGFHSGIQSVLLNIGYNVSHGK